MGLLESVNQAMGDGGSGLHRSDESLTANLPHAVQ
jgi:hypothetical protein